MAAALAARVDHGRVSPRPRFGRGKSLVAHELGAKRPLGLVLVVAPAAQPDPCDRRLATACHLFHMVELEPFAGRASVARIAHEDGMKRLTPAESW